MEGNRINLSVHIGIQHKAIEEVVNIGLSLLSICRNQVIQRHRHTCGSHGKSLSRQAYKYIRRGSSLNGSLDFGHSVVVVSGIYGLHYDIRMLLVEVCADLLDQGSRRTSYVHRVVERQMKGII